jgi:hypothetical protein
MPIERLASLVSAVAVIAALLIAGGAWAPQAWGQAAHFAAFSLLTCLLWRAMDGAMAAVALAGALAVLDAWRDPAADAAAFLAGLCGVLAAAGQLILQKKPLFMQRKPSCAESSPQ